MEVNIEQIRAASAGILAAAGVPQEHAAVVADTICYAHLRSKHTHGIGRMSIYLRKIREGLMAADTPLEVLHDHAALLHLDAHHGFGQVAAYYGMRHAIDRARQFGISFVSIKDSNNFGTAGYFAKMASDAGMLGIVMGNSGPAIAPSGGSEALFGTNPVSVAFPMKDPDRPFVFDMATSVAARGKVRLAAKNGESIPLGWALDKDGQPTTDANAALEGTMLAIGGYKGVGISMVIDMMAGLLSGAAFAGDVLALNHPTGLSRYGHAIAVIDISKLMTEDEYAERIAYFEDRTHALNGTIPGEHAYEEVQKNTERVNIPDKQLAELRTLAQQYGVEINF